MLQNNNVSGNKKNNDSFSWPYQQNDYMKPIRRIIPIIVVTLIIVVMVIFANIQRKVIISSAESATYQMAQHLSSDISEMIDFAVSSINLASINISQSMTSDTIENPSDIINPMIENTPFGGIEYIRADGMNIMNIGEPFDASDREYYKEGIKGKSGI